MTTPRFGTLFHFTHVDNLEEILRAGALMSDAKVEARGLLRNECGNPAIKERRRQRDVPCSPGGVVADYVPFYFAARSPMMLKIKSGHVPTFEGDHRDLVYFVTSVQRILALDLAYVISDRNAAVGVADFANDATVLGDLTSTGPDNAFVDWPVMNLTYWQDTLEYPDRMERRMAEFLVYDECPLAAIAGIAAQNSGIRDTVERMFDEAGFDGLHHAVRANWYY